MVPYLLGALLPHLRGALLPPPIIMWSPSPSNPSSSPALLPHLSGEAARRVRSRGVEDEDKEEERECVSSASPAERLPHLQSSTVGAVKLQYESRHANKAEM